VEKGVGIGMIDKKWFLNTECTYEEIIRNFSSPSDEFAPFCFWFLNGKLNDENSIEMAKAMEAKGLSPGYPQDRGVYDNKFLSDGFFETFRHIIENTKMPFGFCDETGGMYGDSVVNKGVPKSRSLMWKTYELNEDFVVPECLFAVSAKVEDDKILSSTLKVLEKGDIALKNQKLFCFDIYHDRSCSGSEIDYLDSNTAEVIIQNVCEKFAKNLGEYLGNRIPGSFMDLEGDYGYKLAWSEDLETEYFNRFNHDIRLYMPLLFEEDFEGVWMKARWQWFDCVSEVYSNGFFKKLSEWYEKHNMYFTGHTWEENLYGQAIQTGDFFRVMKNFTMIGNDSLRLECYSPRDFREAQTISQLEKKRFMCEALACVGWGISPTEFKRAINCMTAWGVNQFAIHGIYLDRNMDKVGFAPDSYNCNPYWSYFNKITEFAKRASYINSSGMLCVDTILLNPMDSVWALLGDMVFDKEKPFSSYIIEQKNIDECKYGSIIKAIDEVYSKAQIILTNKRIEYYIFDRNYLLEYDLSQINNIVVPSMVMISLNVLKRILEFVENGGNVYFVGDIPYASIENGKDDEEVVFFINKLKTFKNVKFEDIDNISIEPTTKFVSEEFDIIQSHRIIGGKDFFWLVNNTDRKQNAKLLLSNVCGGAKIFDCETGEIKAVKSEHTENGTLLYADFEPYEAYWVVIDKSFAYETVVKEEFSCTILKNTWKIEGNGKVFTTDKLLDWEEMGINDYTGFVTYETEFEVNNNGKIMLDLGNVYHMAEVFVNDIKAGERIWEPFAFDITDLVQQGINRLKIKVGNLMCNSLKEYGDRWQTGIHRKDPEESYKSGFYELKLCIKREG